VIIKLPNGATITQFGRMYHQDPIHVIIPAALQNHLWLNVENPSGRAIVGHVVVQYGSPKILASASIPLVTTPGQTQATLSVPSITQAMMESAIRVTVYDTSNNLVYPTKSIAKTTVLSTRQFAPASSGFFSIEVGGDPSVPSSVNAFPTTGWPGGLPAGSSVLQIDYSTGTGSKYFNLQAWNDPTMNVYRSTNGLSVGMWVYGDQSNVELSTVLRDQTEQRFKLFGPRVNWLGWRWVTFAFGKSPMEFWGGANNGVPQGNVRMYTPLVIDPKLAPTSGHLQVAGIMCVGLSGQ
jgi:hypothetical protein